VSSPSTFRVIERSLTLVLHLSLRWIAIKRADKVKSLLLSSPGWREESAEVRSALQSVSNALLVNKPGRGGDDTGTLPDDPLDDIVAYFIGGLGRLAQAREELRVRFQERCKPYPSLLSPTLFSR
jgi:hypothetical protein